MSSGRKCAPSTISRRCGRARKRRDDRPANRYTAGTMRIVVAAIGRLKQGPERDLAERYRKRAADAGRGVGFRGVEIIEIRESKAREADKRMIEESIALATVIPEGAVTIALDE